MISLGMLLTGVVAICAWTWLTVLCTGRVRTSLRYMLPPVPTSTQEAQASPVVAVLCPGRNEQDHLEAVLPALAQQRSVEHHVLFIDDESDDATPALADKMQQQYKTLRVLRNDDPPPAGWVGKCWALHRGYEYLCELEATGQVARADWLCFTDADINWQPDCLARALAQATQAELDVISLVPQLEVGGWLEAAVQLPMVAGIAILYPFKHVEQPGQDRIVCAGGFLMVKRSWYEQIGGHEAVHDQVVEDVQLGRTLKRAGAKMQLCMGRDVLSTRMYDGWRDMWEGLTKNSYAMLNYKPWLWLLAMLSLPWGTVCMPLWVIFSLAWVVCAGMHSGSVMQIPLLAWLTLAMSIAGYGASVRVFADVRVMVCLPRYSIWLAPVGMGICLAIVTGSMLQYHFTKGNTWKGRQYGKQHHR